jgi:RNA polymerase sigma factor (sigma-70 family)
MSDVQPAGEHRAAVCRAQADERRAAVCRALTADVDAGFAELMRGYGGIVYSVARGLGGGSADAEDLAAETFLRAYRALTGYPPERIEALEPRPWLLTILRNTARNAARDAARRPAGPTRAEPDEADHGGDADPAPGPARRAEQRETQLGLGVLLARLPEVQRTAVVLRHVLDLSTAEIATVLGVREGTAKSHVSRGLQQLRALVTGSDPADPALRAAREAAVGQRGGRGADTAHRVLA